MVKTIKKYWLYGVFLVLAFVLPLIWLPKGYLYISEEDNFANFQNVVYRNLYSWAPPVNNGQPVTPADQSTVIPNGVFYYLFAQLNVPNDVIQKIYLSLMIFLTFTALAYFLKLFTDNKPIILVGVLFYYFNFYVWSTIFYSAKMPQLILLPLFFTYLYRYLESEDYLYAALNFFSLFWLQSIFSNLPTLVVTLLAYPLALAYFFLKNKPNCLDFVRRWWLKLGLFFGLTLPLFLYNALIVYFSLVFNDGYAKLKNIHLQLQSDLHLLFQFRGSWWEFVNYGNISYNPWLWFYNHPLIIVCSFGLVIISLSLFFKKKPRVDHLFWLTVFLGSIFLASGTSFYPPIYLWLFDHLPFFYIFREPWARFTPLVMFALTALLIFSLEDKKRYGRFLILLCLGLVLIKAAPFFSTRLINNSSSRWNNPLMKLPDYWRQYGRWSETHQDQKILSIPISYFKRQWYNDNLGNIDHPLARLFGYAPVLYNIQNNQFGSMLGYFINKNNPNFYKITTIDYLLVQNDIAREPDLYSDALRSYDSLLKNVLAGNLTERFGTKLFLYQVKNELHLPQIYSAQAVIHIDSSINDPDAMDQLTRVVSRPDYQIGSAVFFADNTKTLQPVVETPNRPPVVEFTKISPTKYQVSIRQIQDNFVLVFDESFNQYWKMYALHQPNNHIYETWLPTLNKNVYPLPNANHFLVNGYANAWLINPKNICDRTAFCQKNSDGRYQMRFVIEYWPQRLFDIGALTVGINLFGCGGYLIYIFLKRKKAVNNSTGFDG